MLKGLTNTFKTNCNATEVEYSEYLVLNGTTIPIKAQLKDDTYENGNFIGTFILKQITFETEATYNFRNKEFEYYKVVDGESMKMGTFISTDITINDTTEVVKVIGMDYGLKAQVEYTSSLNYTSGNITLMDVWNECCELSELESGIKYFPNSDFIVDSDQFTGTGATIRDVFKAIAMSSGTFVKIMNDDKIYLIFNELTSDIEEVEVNGSATIENGYKLDDLQLQGNTTQETTQTGKNICPTSIDDWESGQYSDRDGTKVVNNSRIRLKNLLKVNPSTTYYLNTYATNTNYKFVIRTYDSTGTFVKSIGARDNPATITTTNNEYYFGITMYNSTNSSINFNAYSSLFASGDINPFICLNSESDKSYEPFVPNSPSPDYPQAINKVSGRQEISIGVNNVFDWSVGGSAGEYLTEEGTIETGSTNLRYTDYIEIPIGFSKLSVSGISQNNNMNAPAICFYDNLKTFISGEKYNSRYTPIFDIPNGAKYFRTSYRTVNTDFSIKPVNIYEINLGKNLFDKSTATEGYRLSPTGTLYTDADYTVSDYIPVEPNTTYIRNLEPSVYQCVVLYKSDKTFINRVATTIQNFTTTNDTYYIRFSMENDNVDTTQLEKGNQITSYSPYKEPIELCKIGDYQDFIKKGTGKNLCDGINQLVYINQATTKCGKATGNTGLYIPVNGGKYTISTTTTQTRYRVCCSVDIPPGSGTTDAYNGTNKDGTNATITIDTTNYNYLIVNATDLSSIQIEKGETATTYEPYGMYNKWYIEKQIGKVVLDGTQSLSRVDTGTTGYYRFNVDIGTNIFATDSTTIVAPIYCNRLKGVSRANTWSRIEGIAPMTTSYSYRSFNLYIEAISQMTTTQANTWFSNNQTIVYYQYKTPTYTEITDSELIEQLNAPRLFEGLNNVSVSSGDLGSPLKISYYNDNLDIVEDYTELEDKRDTHPWTCLRLGTSQIDGNNLDYIDQELVEEYGENWLILNDNPFAYSMEKKQQLIMNIFNQIKEFGYSAFVSKTTFKPYLTSGDIIKFKNRDGNFVKSILLRYNHNGEIIELSAPSETSATVNYVRPLNESQQIKNLQIIVDQDKEQITSIVETTNAQSTNINNLTSMVNSQGESIATLGTRLTQTTNSITASVSAIQEELDNGVNLVKTTSVLINDLGLNVSTDLSKITAVISNNAFIITTKGSDNPLTFFGYDEVEQTSKAEMDNLTIDKYLTVGYHRTEKYEENYEKRTGWFYIGG